MDTEDNHVQLRIAVATILAMVGAAFMSRLPQYIQGQQAISWYQSGFFWTGIAIVVLALVILIINPRYWKRAWQSIWQFRTWPCRAYLWKRYGPKYTIENPIFKQETTNGGNKIMGTTTIFMENKDHEVIRVWISSTFIVLKQKRGRVWITPRELKVWDGNAYEEIQPCGKACYNVIMSLEHMGKIVDNWPDLSRRYHWKLHGPSVTLKGIADRPLSSKEGWINAKEKDSN